MKTIIIILCIFLISSLIIPSCLPDRLPPDPTEVTRPEFVSFGDNDQGGINVPLDDPIEMTFNEKMDPNTFPDNFILTSISGEITGSFSASGSVDSIIIFSPSNNMNPGEVYEVTVNGGVRDVYGNSMISPTEEEVPQTSWFYTTGQYANNGFPYVFVSDKLGELVYRVGSINEYKDNKSITTASREMRFTPDGSKLVVVNKANPGVLTIIDPLTMTEIKTIDVGVGSEHLYISEQKIYVSDVSGKSFSVVDLNSLTLENTVTFSDGYAPRDIVYSAKTDKVYLTSNTRNDYANIRVVDASDYSSYYDADNIMLTNRSQDMEISSDGEYIFLNELRSTNLIIYSTSTDTIVNVLQTDYFQNADGVAYDDAYYFISTGLDNTTGVFKVVYASLNLEAQSEINLTGLTSLDITAAGELLYVVSPNDSTLKVIETGTLRHITDVKVPGTLSTVAISKLNY